MRRASLAALTLAGAAGIHTATAQTAGTPPPIGDPASEEAMLTATVSQSFEADSNYRLDNDSPGTSYLADTRLGLGILRDTTTQRFEFGIDTGLRALWEAEEDFEFTLADPTGGVIAYAQEGPNSAFDGELRYRQRRTDYIRGIDEFITDEGVLPDNLDDIDRRDDTRELRFDADVGVEFNTSAPSRYALRFIGSSIDYSEDVSGLTPRQSGQIEGAWELQITPVFSTIAAATYYRYEADNPRETSLTVGEIDAGLVYQPDENIRVRGGLGYADRAREETIGGERETVDANSGATLRGDFFYVQDAFNLAGDGRLTTAAPQTRFSFNVRGNYVLARGRLNGRVFNRYSTKDNGDTEVRVSGAAIGLIRDINTVSRVGLDLAWANEVNLDADTSDITRTALTATYSYDLTEVVTTDLGYRFQNRLRDSGDAESHQVFFAIGRTFQTGL
jgi:hypothetical protein